MLAACRLLHRTCFRLQITAVGGCVVGQINMHAPGTATGSKCMSHTRLMRFVMQCSDSASKLLAINHGCMLGERPLHWPKLRMMQAW